MPYAPLIAALELEKVADQLDWELQSFAGNTVIPMYASGGGSPSGFLCVARKKDDHSKAKHVYFDTMDGPDTILEKIKEAAKEL